MIRREPDHAPSPACTSRRVESVTDVIAVAKLILASFQIGSNLVRPLSRRRLTRSPATTKATERDPDRSADRAAVLRFTRVTHLRRRIPEVVGVLLQPADRHAVDTEARLHPVFTFNNTKMIILPRHAWDKHRKSAQKRTTVLAGPARW